MKKSSQLGVMALAGAGSAVGGYAIGAQVDAQRTTKATSAMGSYGVLFPLVIGALGYLTLKGKHKDAANGIAIGGVLGAAFGFYKFGQPAAAAAAGNSSGNAGGTGGAGNLSDNSSPSNAGTGGGGSPGGGSGTQLGAMPRRRMRRMGSMAGVRRALNSPSGSGIGDFILPKRFQTGGGGAFGKDAWSRS